MATRGHGGRQRLLVSVRGKREAFEAMNGGAHIVDVEYPASALGTPYPLNIRAVRASMPRHVVVSTNIGEMQLSRGTACQAALGVAVAGADVVKAGLAKMAAKEATYLARSIVRTLRSLSPHSASVLAFFADPELASVFVDPFGEAPSIAGEVRANGVLVDTYDKSREKGLLDYASLSGIRDFVATCHSLSVEAWIAGSITPTQLKSLWGTGVDVICVRAAACDPNPENPRFGRVSAKRVSKLVATMPSGGR